jgi:hypothetical protein
MTDREFRCPIVWRDLKITLSPYALRLTDMCTMRYPLPVLRSPPRRDEGWMLHALCKYLRDWTAFEKKRTHDRALKLAEIGKPKANWELQGLLGLAAFVGGFLAGR